MAYGLRVAGPAVHRRRRPPGVVVPIGRLLRCMPQPGRRPSGTLQSGLLVGTIDSIGKPKPWPLRTRKGTGPFFGLGLGVPKSVFWPKNGPVPYSMSTTSTLLSPELLARLEKMELLSRKIFRGRMKGERRSRRKGQSVEFADFRNYVPGDDLRFVDWNTYARLERLFLKLFLEEEDLHFYALLDASASMDFGEPTKLRYAQQLAAALGFVGLVRGDRVKIETLGQAAAARSSVFRGRRSMWRLFDHIESFVPGETVSLAQGVKNFCLRNSGKGIVVLIGDLMDKAGYEPALRYLLAQQMDVYVVQVLSAEEIDPELVGDLRLVDCEDGDQADVTVSAPLMKRYKQTLAAFVESARDFCTRRGMVYLLVRNEVPLEEMITDYLAQRGLIR